MFAASLAATASAQLAITEVMSAATKENPDSVTRRPDYWELTNFGTNEVNLNGYSFRDRNPSHTPVWEPFNNLVIRGGESVIFFLTSSGSITTPAQFRAWWGESRLPADLQCRPWGSPALSGWDGDAVWLFDPSGNVVDGVEFGRGRSGRSFTYEPETGIFGVLSAAGVNGAFVAEVGGDIGSPGTTIGPVPARFLQPPPDQSVDAGMEVTFTAAAAGVPHPRYLWFAHDTPIPNGTNATLVLYNVQPADAGEYQLSISNGVAAPSSAVAMLTVNTNPAPPAVINPPADATIFTGQTARFTVVARGFPTPGYQWSENGMAIPNAVGPVLEIPNATETMSGRRYSVRLQNALGTAEASAALTVTPRPDLRFTEVMPRPAKEGDDRHTDWFELTNFDTNAVNLLGWRLADAPAFARAFTITNALTLQPGESAVFVLHLNAERFAAWWGADSLPESLKLYTYSGFGLEQWGETLYLWNPSALDPFDPVATVAWAAATPGVSFESVHWCDPDGSGCLDQAFAESTLGLRGAFRALDSADIGSPGYVANPPLRLLAVNRDAGGEMTLRCRVVPGNAYRLCRTPSLSSLAWTRLEVQTATNNVITWTHRPSSAPGSVWFYRVEEAR